MHLNKATKNNYSEKRRQCKNYALIKALATGYFGQCATHLLKSQLHIQHQALDSFDYLFNAYHIISPKKHHEEVSKSHSDVTLCAL